MNTKSRAQILGENLKRIRQARGKTRKDLAELLKVDLSTVGLYENGKSQPPLEKIFQIADYLQVSVSSLTGENQYSPFPVDTDAAIWDYRLKHCLQLLADPFDYFATLNADGSVEIVIPAKIETDEKTGALTFKYGQNGVKFPNAKLFVEVIDKAISNAVSGNVTFNQALRRIIFNKP